jgi:hypothetical protein
MKQYLYILPIIAATGLSAQEASNSLFEGDFYARTSVSYQSADSYYDGSGSFASFVFDAGEGEYTFINYNVDLAYSLPSGFYLASGLYATDGEVETNGLGIGVPNTDSGLELREVPLAFGYATTLNGIFAKAEVKYTFNVDDDFDSSSIGQAITDEVLLPVTDGSDYWTFSGQLGTQHAGFKHTLSIAYQIFEEDAEHPLFPRFTLGDRFSLDYQVSYEFDNGVNLYLGHLFVWSEETEGDPSPFIQGLGLGDFNYVYNQPRYQEVRTGIDYQATESIKVELGGAYFYDGSDAPKQTTIFAALAFTF